VFRPARYLAENRLPYPNERGYNTFGWGRRQCPGQPLAEQGLFLSLTRLIWAFEIRPALDTKVCLLKRLSNCRAKKKRSISLRIPTEKTCGLNRSGPGSSFVTKRFSKRCSNLRGMRRSDSESMTARRRFPFKISSRILTSKRSRLCIFK
jgi:Cytochrome P450